LNSGLQSSQRQLVHYCNRKVRAFPVTLQNIVDRDLQHPCSQTELPQRLNAFGMACRTVVLDSVSLRKQARTVRIMCFKEHAAERRTITFGVQNLSNQSSLSRNAQDVIWAGGGFFYSGFPADWDSGWRAV
jgi:hypothetical protein